MEKILDCMGMACPLPVINAKKAIDAFTEDGTLIVLERELSRKGVDPSYRARLYAVRPSRDAAFDRDHPIAKKLLFGADTGTANYEGVCAGPTLDNGDRTLVMVSDGGEADDERLYVLRMTSSQEARQ